MNTEGSQWKVHYIKGEQNWKVTRKHIHPGRQLSTWPVQIQWLLHEWNTSWTLPHLPSCLKTCKQKQDTFFTLRQRWHALMQRLRTNKQKMGGTADQWKSKSASKNRKCTQFYQQVFIRMLRSVNIYASYKRKTFLLWLWSPQGSPMLVHSFV